MSKPIIEVRDVSKSFMISHEKNERYVSLRDVISEKAKKIFSFHKSFNHSSQLNGYSKEEFWALKDISFDIMPGDRVGIIGRNGAGKSTLLKILSRITEPTKGNIKIRGRVASLLEVGTGFHPELTGRENIYLNGAILGMSRLEIRKKFDEIVAFAEVEIFLDTAVKRYSSGMYVRLAFSVAAHLEPEILVVDEVLAVGDLQFQKKCLGKMEDVSSMGRTVLFVSHNLAALKSLCNAGILLHKGEKGYEGNIQRTIDSYLQINKHITSELNTDFLNIKSEFIKITSISIKGNPKDDSFTLETILSIIIEYEILREGNLLFNIHLYNIEDILIFDSCSNPELYKISKKGKIKCEIPGNLLNDGDHSVDISVVLNHTVEILKLKKAICFEILENKRNINWHGKWPGIIRPKLNWVNHKMSSYDD